MTRILSLYRGVVERRHVDCRTMAEIVADVAARYGIPPDVLRGASRRKWFARARHEAMAEAYATGRYSLPQIGRYLGGRHHTTVLHGVCAHRDRTLDEIGKCRSAYPMAAE